MEPDGINIKNCKLEIGHINEETGEVEYTTLEYGDPVSVDLITDSVDLELKNSDNIPYPLTYTFSSPLKGTGVNKMIHFFGMGKDRSRRTKFWWAVYKQYKKIVSARKAKQIAWWYQRPYRSNGFSLNCMNSLDIDEINLSFVGEDS